MKIDFEIPNDGKTHEYCFVCKSESVTRSRDVEGQLKMDCSACGAQSDRAIYFDPKIIWWIDESKEYWHESAGVFLRAKSTGKYLFFERNVFPFVYTIPAGHVDIGEEAKTAALRELEEEVGIRVNDALVLTEEPIATDSCARGADAHMWHVYVTEIEHEQDIQVLEEGEKPIWLSAEEARELNVTPPLRYFLQTYKSRL